MRRGAARQSNPELLIPAQKILVRQTHLMGDVSVATETHMRAPAPTKGTERLSDSQRAALISLLRDDDPGVFETVHAKLVSFGPQVVGWLRPYTISDDALL